MILDDCAEVSFAMPACIQKKIDPRDVDGRQFSGAYVELQVIMATNALTPTPYLDLFALTLLHLSLVVAHVMFYKLYPHFNISDQKIKHSLLQKKMRVCKCLANSGLQMMRCKVNAIKKDHKKIK